MSRRIVKLSVLVGILILSFMIYSIGIDKIWKNIKEISIINFIILFLMRLLYWILRTINWKTVLINFEKDISLKDLFFARISGHAISQLTPAAQFGSELTRTVIINKNNDSKKVVASVILDKTIEFISVLFFSFIGVVGLIFRIKLSENLKIILLSSIFIAAILVISFIIRQRKGLFGWIFDILERFKFGRRFSQRHRSKIDEIDSHLTQFYEEHKKVFLKVSLLYMLLVLFWISEIYLTINYLGITNISFFDAFFITVIGNFALVFQITPGGLGIYEATYIGLFALLRINAASAVSIVFIRRIISLILAGFGLITILFHRSRT